MIVTPELNRDTNWYPDSGATNHITHDLDNRSVSNLVSGGQHVHTVNGASLSILYSSYSSILTPSKHLSHLQNLLHVPFVSKNLLSVSQFAIDNNVFFEFHPTFCLVKD